MIWKDCTIEVGKDEFVRFDLHKRSNGHQEYTVRVTSTALEKSGRALTETDIEMLNGIILNYVEKTGVGTN
jgi:hypothetical protein